jgi:hypothetical protein
LRFDFVTLSPLPVVIPIPVDLLLSQCGFGRDVFRQILRPFLRIVFIISFVQPRLSLSILREYISILGNRPECFRITLLE